MNKVRSIFKILTNPQSDATSERLTCAEWYMKTMIILGDYFKASVVDVFKIIFHREFLGEIQCLHCGAKMNEDRKKKVFCLSCIEDGAEDEELRNIY